MFSCPRLVVESFGLNGPPDYHVVRTCIGVLFTQTVNRVTFTESIRTDMYVCTDIVCTYI